MGSRYDTTCKDCGYQYSLSIGGGWTWYQKICNLCGLEIKVPTFGPVDFEDGKSLTYDELLNHLKSPDRWSRRGGRFDDTEKELLDQMTTQCKCGGSFIPEWDKAIKHRCPKCKSSNLLLENEILYD